MLILGLVKKAIFSLWSKQDKKEVNQIYAYIFSPKNMVALLWLVLSICYSHTGLLEYTKLTKKSY